MSIAPPVGAMSTSLCKLVLVSSHEPERSNIGTLFEDLGFEYVGPIDGHDLEELIATLERARDSASRPIGIHAVTQKGKGYLPVA
jgi:deoxyxylulose-5-phosphate synthase